MPPFLSDPDFERISNALYAYAKRRLRSEDDIFDLLQDTYATYYQSPGNFEGRSALLTYLTGILKNKIFNLYRKQNLEMIVDDQDFEKEQAKLKNLREQKNTPERLTSLKETGEIISYCLSQLTSPYYEAFVLREIEQLPTTEICNILSVSVTNLNVILHRARKQLRALLVAQGIETPHEHF